MFTRPDDNKAPATKSVNSLFEKSYTRPQKLITSVCKKEDNNENLNNLTLDQNSREVKVKSIKRKRTASTSLQSQKLESNLPVKSIENDLQNGTQVKKAPKTRKKNSEKDLLVENSSSFSTLLKRNCKVKCKCFLFIF